MFFNRWLMLGVLFIARFALGFQFQSAGSVTPFMVQDFGVDYAGIGTFVGLYMIPGLFLTVPSGFLGRRFGDKRLVLLGLTMMAAGGVIAGEAALGCGIALLAISTCATGVDRRGLSVGASSVLFAVAMMVATLMLAGLFRLAQAYIPVRA